MSCSDGRAAERKIFSVRQTHILKGIAVLLLLVHHGLDPVSKELSGFAGRLAVNGVSYAKLCVAVFALLSGYGMYLSYERREKPMARFVLAHILKLYAVFLLAALVQIAVVACLRGGLAAIYPERPAFFMLLDVLAFSYHAGTPKFVNAWWYVTATLIYYCLFPLFYAVVRRLRYGNLALLALLAAAVFVLPMTSIRVYGCVFVTGMIFAERDVFNWFLNLYKESAPAFWAKLFGCLAVFAGLSLLRQKFLADTRMAYYGDWLIALALILLVGVFTCRWMPKRAWLLELTGRYSFEIYLVHSAFIKHFPGYVYITRDCLGVMLRLFLGAFLAGAALHWLIQKLGIPKIPTWCYGQKPVS